MALNDRRLAFVLGAVLVIIVVAELFVWLPSYRASSGTAQALPTATPAPAGIPLAAANAPSTAQPAGFGDYDRDTPPGPAARDPFTPPAEVRNAAHTTATPPNARRVSATPPRRGDVLPSFPSGPLTIQPATVPAPVAPTVELKGVIPGDPAIAVINVGGQVHYKEEGDSLGAGLRVARITEAGVVIQRSGRNVVLGVGHTLTPELPGAPPAAQPNATPTRTQPTPRVTAPDITPTVEPRKTTRPKPSVDKAVSSTTPDVSVSATPSAPKPAAKHVRHRHVRVHRSGDDPLAGHFVGRRL